MSYNVIITPYYVKLSVDIDPKEVVTSSTHQKYAYTSPTPGRGGTE